MKTYQDQGLNLPSQNCRRRSLPGLPTMQQNYGPATANEHTSPIISVTDTPTSQRNFQQSQHLERRNTHMGDLVGDKHTAPSAPSRPPRPSLYLQFDNPESADPTFNAYHSPHAGSPLYAPQVMLEFPSEESSRRPSRCSGISGSCSPSPFLSNSQLHSGLLHPAPYRRRINRRASHAGNLGQTAPNHYESPSTPLQPFLNVPRSRSRGSSLPDEISSSELYRLRNFSTSGKKVINKGDSYRSRNSSMNSSRSR